MKVEVAVLGSPSLTVLMVSVGRKATLKRIRREEKKKRKKKELWFYFFFFFFVSVVEYTVHLLTVLQFISSKRKRRYQNTNCALIFVYFRGCPDTVHVYSPTRKQRFAEAFYLSQTRHR